MPEEICLKYLFTEADLTVCQQREDFELKISLRFCSVSRNCSNTKNKFEDLFGTKIQKSPHCKYIKAFSARLFCNLDYIQGFFMNNFVTFARGFFQFRAV